MFRQLSAGEDKERLASYHDVRVVRVVVHLLTADDVIATESCFTKLEIVTGRFLFVSTMTVIGSEVTRSENGNCDSVN